MDLDAMDQMDTDSLVDRARVLVTDSPPDSIYEYQQDSVAVADGVNVVAPSSNVGRYILQSTASSPRLIYSDSVEQAADIQTTSNVFSQMGSMTRTTPSLPSGSRMLFWFEATTFIPSTGDLMYFRVLLDGVEQKRRGIFIGNLGANSVSIVGKTGALAAGAHTLKVEWANTSNLNALSCRPATQLLEGASLTLQALTA